MPAADKTSESQSGESPQMIRIDEALERILNSSSFSSSRQAQQLLRYLVEKSLQEDDGALKERIIGIEVFGRKSDYNTGDDPIVRARIGDIRKRLAQYYLNEEPSHVRIQLSIPPGSYRVAYKLVDAVQSASEPALQLGNTNLVSNQDKVLPSNDLPNSDAKTLSSPQRPSRRRLVYALIGVAIIVSVMLTFVIKKRQAESDSAIDQFWAPMSRDSNRVLIYVGTNAVYSPIGTKEQNDLSARSTAVLPPVTKPVTLGPKDIMAVNHEFTTSGDLLASVKITSYFTAHHISYEVRMGENITAGELRHSPTVLIGGNNNFWTIETSKYLPIAYTEFGLKDVSGNHTVWTDHLSADQKRGESYAIAARISDPETGEPIILVAGVTSLGTRAASQFITDPNALKALASTAPPGWAKKNIEVVLRTDVVERDTGTPTVVAARYW